MSEPNSSDRLSFTIFLAIAVHAVIIFGIGFTINKSNKVAPTLNITLATHASAKAPEKADFLAQNNQEGSGTLSEVKELTTTELAEAADTAINEINPIQSSAARVEVQHEDKTLLSTTNQAKRKLPKHNSVESPENAQDGDAESDLIARNNKLASLQAKLDKQRNAFAREPRITRHTSVSAKTSDEAAYYNYWSNKVVRVGNNNFPQEALDKGIFGSLRLEVGVRADGTVAFAHVTGSSGQTILDEAAKQIVRLASPFNPLPPEITKTTDIFVVYRTWNFQITGLSTSD